MRALVIAALMLVPISARADSFLELAGGISIPTGDSNWTKIADTSPKLGARVGATNDDGIGGMLQADWTPVDLNNMGGSFGALGSTSVAAHVFRVLADFTFHHRLRAAPHLIATGRAGIGIDIAHASYQATVLGATSSASDTDVGLAVEFGGGIWYEIGSAQIGAELAVPISNHSKATDSNGIGFQYASYDIDLLFGVRLVSR